jgi:hypothetical protein
MARGAGWSPAMELKLSYDAAIDAWTLAHRDVHLNTVEDVAEWRRRLTTELLDKLGSQPVYLLVDVQGFEVAATRMEDYGRTVKSIAHHFLAVIRYGATSKTQTAVLLQSVLNHYQPNLYPDRTAAIQALKQLRNRRGRVDRARPN